MVSPSRFAYILLGLVIFLPGYVVLDKPKATRNVEITAEDEKLRDPAGYAAIKELHRLMDDDQSGSIDRFESNDFLQEDMKLTGSDRARRERAFHHDDDAITVDDMWESWFESEERSWDEKHTLDWLINIVKLPQYEKIFIEHKVNGVSLPRMALQNSSYLATVLGIKNFVHRQKLQLKALDLVLFGFQEPSGSRFKDVILLVLTLLCIILGYVLTKFHTRSKQQVEELTQKLTELKSMETEFEGAQKRFDYEDEDAESVIVLKTKLEEAERRLEMTGGESISFSVQPLLRRTYELEIGCINEKKLECLQEMKEAKDFVDKMRKRQGNLLNSIKLAAGATALGTDVVDAKVFSLKQRMEKLKSAMDECQHRWIEIENLCGFSITGSSYENGSGSQKVPSSQGFMTSPTFPYQFKAAGTHTGPLNGTLPVSLSGSKLSPPMKKMSQPTHVPSNLPTSFYISSGPSSVAGSDTPPTTINSQSSASVKAELSALRPKTATPISEDTNSLGSTKSSSSIGNKLNSMFKRKVKT